MVPTRSYISFLLISIKYNSVPVGLLQVTDADVCVILLIEVKSGDAGTVTTLIIFELGESPEAL